MATGTENGAAMSEEQVERRLTERVILQRRRALVIPDSATDEQIEEAAKALAPRKGKGFLVDDVWIEVARRTGATKRAAIEAYSGKAGTADAKVGEYRAPSSTAWKDGLKLKAPPKPLIEAEAFE